VCAPDVKRASPSETIEGEIAVKSLLQVALGALVTLALLAAPRSAAVAQQDQTLKPVAIVSVASIKETLADIGYVTRVAGMADYGDTAKFFAGALRPESIRSAPSVCMSCRRRATSTRSPSCRSRRTDWPRF